MIIDKATRYFNATKLCHEGGKDFKHWLENKGSKELLEFCLENKYYISLSGIVTFKNANLLREILKNASLDYLLLETDSPYLAPMPMRGKDNEPSFVKFTANYLADYYSIDKDAFFKLTDNNFYKLFSRVNKDS